MFEGYLEGFGMVSGRCLEDIQKISGGNLECVRKVTGRSQDCVWRLSERCLENIKIFLLVWRIREVLLAIFCQSVSLSQYMVLSVILLQLASELSCDVVAKRSCDYCPLRAISYQSQHQTFESYSTRVKWISSFKGV